MFNWGNGASCGGDGIWSCLISLVILIVVLQFVCGIFGQGCLGGANTNTNDCNNCNPCAF